MTLLFFFLTPPITELFCAFLIYGCKSITEAWLRGLAFSFVLVNILRMIGKWEFDLALALASTLAILSIILVWRKNSKFKKTIGTIIPIAVFYFILSLDFIYSWAD